MTDFEAVWHFELGRRDSISVVIPQIPNVIHVDVLRVEPEEARHGKVARQRKVARQTMMHPAEACHGKALPAELQHRRAEPEEAGRRKVACQKTVHPAEACHRKVLPAEA